MFRIFLSCLASAIHRIYVSCIHWFINQFMILIRITFECQCIFKLQANLIKLMWIELNSDALTHPFNQSPQWNWISKHSSIHSCNQPEILLFIHSFTHSFTHSLTHSGILCNLILISFIHSLNKSFINSFIWIFTHFPYVSTHPSSKSLVH